MQPGSNRWWVLILPIILSVFASSLLAENPYGRQTDPVERAATTPLEIIELELESAEAKRFRRFLGHLPNDQQRALLSVVSQMGEGQKGLIVARYILPDKASGRNLALLASRIGSERETGLASALARNLNHRWNTLKRAFADGIDVEIIVGAIRGPDDGEFCEPEAAIPIEERRPHCVLEGPRSPAEQALIEDWHRSILRMIHAEPAPKDAARYQVQLMRAGNDRAYYHDPKRSRYEMEQYGRRLEDFERDHVCGAVYIGDDFALTAAHCVEGWRGYDSEFFAGRRIRAGTIYIDEVEGEPRSTGEIIPIKSVVIHADYRDGKAYAGYDIALLKLAKVPRRSATTAAQIPQFPRNRLSSGAKLVQTGWGLMGATNNSQLARDLKGNLQAASRRLRIGEMELFDNTRCDKNPAFKNKRVKLRYGQICVGSDDGVDACKGDSGGPLVQKVPGRSPVLVGLVSWGIGCGIEDRPAIYTDVGAFYTWILLAKGAARDSRMIYTK